VYVVPYACPAELDLRTPGRSVRIRKNYLELRIVRQKWQLPGDPVSSLTRLAIRNTAQSLS
jgi:hypothetical protein